MASVATVRLFVYVHNNNVQSNCTAPIAIAVVKEKQIALSQLAEVYLLIILCA